MSKYRDHLAAQIRAALGPHNDPELPVAECVARLVATQPAPGADISDFVSCGCGDLYAPDSFGAGFIAATGQCPNCKAAQPSAEPEPEPVAWMCGDSATACEAVRDDWTRQGFEVRPLYAQPTDSAALRDAAIAELVRRKMTGGNSVPVERCIITAAEIGAIAHHQTTGESE